MYSEDLIDITILVREKSFLTLALRKYHNESNNFGTRNLSPGTNDRFAIDFFTYSVIIELWFLRRMLNV